MAQKQLLHVTNTIQHLTTRESFFDTTFVARNEQQVTRIAFGTKDVLRNIQFCIREEACVSDVCSVFDDHIALGTNHAGEIPDSIPELFSLID